MSEENLLSKWAQKNQFRHADLARMLRTSQACVYKWCSGKACPMPKMALRIQKLTQSQVPFSYWGYINKGDNYIRLKKVRP